MKISIINLILGLLSILILCSCQYQKAKTVKNLSDQFLYMDRLHKNPKFIESINSNDEIMLNDSSEYFIHADLKMTPNSITFIKTKIENDTFIYILLQDTIAMTSKSHLTKFKDIHDLYKCSIQKSNSSIRQTVSLIGINKKDNFAFTTYLINSEGPIIVDGEKIGFDEIMPALPYTNSKDTIYTINQDSVTVSYEERIGVDNNTVSYIAKVKSPNGCINSFASAGIETESNQIDILRFSEPSTDSKFIIYLEGKRRKVWLENFHSGCDEIEIMNLIEE